MALIRAHNFAKEYVLVGSANINIIIGNNIIIPLWDGKMSIRLSAYGLSNTK